jgi:hypothetical protein
MGLDILRRNLMRVVEDEDEDGEKYALSLSIVNFIKASSRCPAMQPYMKNKDTLFRDILINEDLSSSEQVCRIPIDIENSLVGAEMNCLIDTISGQETIQPYSDVSTRVLMKIADVLMCRDEGKFYKIGLSDKVIEGLKEHQEKEYRKKKE